MGSGRTLPWAVIGSLWVGLGYILVLATFRFCQGPEPTFDLGNGYHLLNWPGVLVRLKSVESGGYESLLPHKVTALYVKAPWVIGKTEDAWFAVDTAERKTYYPLESSNTVEFTTRLRVGQSDLVTNPVCTWFPSRYELIWPSTRGWVEIIAILYLTVTAVCVLLWSAIRRRIRRWRSTFDEASGSSGTP